MAFKWTNDKIEKLLDMYEEREHLYNTKHEKYYDRVWKEHGYNEIATALEVTGSLCIFASHLLIITPVIFLKKIGKNYLQKFT